MRRVHPNQPRAPVHPVIHKVPLGQRVRQQAASELPTEGQPRVELVRLQLLQQVRIQVLHGARHVQGVRDELLLHCD